MRKVDLIRRPSRSLAITVSAIVAVGILLPFTPMVGWFGFVALPLGYFAFLVAAVAVHLALVEVVKRKLMARLVM